MEFSGSHVIYIQYHPGWLNPADELLVYLKVAKISKVETSPSVQGFSVEG